MGPKRWIGGVRHETRDRSRETGDRIQEKFYKRRRHETGDRRHDTEDRYIYSNKKVMGKNFLKNTAQLRNFLLAKIVFPLHVARWH